MSLQPYVDQKVLVVTADGRTLTGTLLSCDQLTNLVLQNTIERVIRPHEDPEDSEEVPHGLYLIRGENVAICGLLDEQMDGEIDWAKVKGSVIGGVKHAQKPGGANMFQEPVRRKKLRDDLWVKGHSPRNTRAAVSLNKNGQTVQYVLQF
ncbi:hypothetical protein HO133_002810 [Letharia lupina]|uniref:LSM2-LSM8 complex subunit LSM8 n=2 Tax=Letharia TaxID=112415 RepID=A0A8H6CCX5_9LECA|nr:uncharacterized protein HO133_002810 [Letharia lupina]KAF6221129.1 hypothetical protein HO133_002810 [Letharia lupina]